VSQVQIGEPSRRKVIRGAHARSDANRYGVRIPGDADQRSELMSITVPK
jgi:hypothetical protein